MTSFSAKRKKVIDSLYDVAILRKFSTMASIQLTAVIISLLSIIPGNVGNATPTTTSPGSRKDCILWNEVIGNLSTQRGMSLSCAVNEPCTGFCCNGTYSMLIRSFEIDFVYIMVLYPCAKPVAMGIEVNIPKKKVNFHKIIHHNDTEKIANMTYDVGIFKIDPYITAVMTPGMENGQKYLDVSAKLEIRMDFLGQTSFPIDDQRYIVSRQRIPVDKCDGQPVQIPVLDPTHKPKCIPPTLKPTKPTVVPGKGGKGCEVGLLFGDNTCEDKEKCVAKNNPGRGGVCICIECYTRHPYTLKCQLISSCKPDSPKYVDHVVDYVDSKPGGIHNSVPNAQAQTKKSSNKTTIIAATCGTIGFLVAIAVAMGLVIMVRRRRLRYRDHDILMNNEDPVI